jgi:hypothetical protein
MAYESLLLLEIFSMVPSLSILLCCCKNPFRSEYRCHTLSYAKDPSNAIERLQVLEIGFQFCLFATEKTGVSCYAQLP